MPLDENERAELAKKISQQRRAMWKGQTTKKDARTKKKRGKKEQIVAPQQEHEAAEQIPESQYQPVEEERSEEPKPPVIQDEKAELAEKIRQQRRTVWKGEPAAPGKRRKREWRSARRNLNYQRVIKPTEQPIVNQPDEREAKEKSRKYGSKIPALKLALIVILGLIGAIAIGVAIGYLAAARNLIKI